MSDILEKRIGFSEVTGGRALCFRNLSMGKQQVSVSSMNRDMDVFFLKPKKHLLIYWLKMRPVESPERGSPKAKFHRVNIKSRGLLYWNSHIL